MNELLNLQAITKIADLKSAMMDSIATGDLIEIEPPLAHYFAKGLYGRRIYVPAGFTVVTKVHLSQHITIALKGHCTLVDEQGNKQEIYAPGVWVTEPGTQRAVHCHDDVEWLTVHAVDSTDLEEIETTLVCETFDEYNIKLLARN